MNMNWTDWAVLVTMAVVMFFIPIVIGKYIDMRVRLAVKNENCCRDRLTLSVGLQLQASLWRSVVGLAYVILPDGRVFAFPGRKVAEAAILGCDAGYFKVMTDRGRRGLEGDEISRKFPDSGTVWRVKMGDAIVYFETVFYKGLRSVLEVEAVEVSTFWTELESVRAGAVQGTGQAPNPEAEKEAEDGK